MKRLSERVCHLCGYVHASDAARRMNRFSAGKKIYVAKHGNIQRSTRVEAEKDECSWRTLTNKPGGASPS